MEKILKQAFIDAEAYEMVKAYHVDTALSFEFKDRQDDFYITLITRMMNCLEQFETEDGEEKEIIKQSLADIAKGLIVYSEIYTSKDFEGVNVVNNHLFVAAIYYVCGYEAIASLLLKSYWIHNYSSVAGQLMFYIISGCRVTRQEHKDFADIIDPFDEYMATGDEKYLERIIGFFENKVKDYDYRSPRDFMDSRLLLHVLHKFQASNIWRDLKHYDPNTNWMEYVAYSKEEHILSFLPSQRDALDRGLLSFEQSFSLGLATSGGKSYITELLIYQELKRNPMAKILYLAPLRSLSRELKMRFREVGRKFNIKCSSKYGGNVIDVGDSSIEEAQLLISTPETFITLEGVLDEELREFSLIICDEGQLLEDATRGIRYELLLTRLKKQEHKRFMFLSAIIPNIEDINEWLGGGNTQVSKSDYRPCDLRYGIAKTYKGAIDVDIWDRSLQGSAFTISSFVDKELCKVAKKGKTSVTCLTALKSLPAGPVMIYSSTKKGPVGCVTICAKIAAIIEEIPELSPRYFSNSEAVLEDLKEYIQYMLGDTYPLVNYVANGFAYHHGDLPQDIREVIENGYAKSAISLIVCTSTLAEGVNMPIKTLVAHNLLDPASYGNEHGPRYLPIASIKNIVGRVGRAGKQRYGVVIVPESDNGAAENKVLLAMKSEGISLFHGTLYELVTIMRRHNWQEASNEQINVLLEDSGLADGIDLMISRNAENDDIQTVNPDEICQASLAYKLGTETDRQMLVKVFEARYASMNELAERGDYPVFLETGLTLVQYKDISETIKEEDIERFAEFNESKQEEFLSYIIPLLQTVGLLDEGINKDLFFNVTVLFLKGKTYSEIANIVGISSDIVMQLTNTVQNVFSDGVRSAITFVKRKFEVENANLDDFPDYLKFGVWTSYEYELVTSRLSDRIAAHGMAKYVNEVLGSAYADVMFLKIYPDRILGFFKEKGYPLLTIERVESWLKS
ncbi:MAG: DEAD/DEAH box helicase [Bacteroidales bacterium]|nr:DEAD/DEAH box helicase [Bacteroidales bacterium]